MAAYLKKGEPDTPWPYTEPELPRQAPQPYVLHSERKQPEGEEEAQMAEAPGGPKGSYMREVEAMRAQMASMTQLRKKKPQKADIEDLRYPPRRGGTLKRSGSLRAGEKLKATSRPVNPDRQLASVPENGTNGMIATNALAIVSVDNARKEQTLVFPAFNGQSVQHFGKEVEEPAAAYPAKPYWEDASAENKARAAMPMGVTGRGINLFHRQRRIAWLGFLAMAFYLCALGFYLWVRIAKTLDLGPYRAYGIVVLIVECLGASTVLLYGMNLLFEPVLPVSEAELATESTTAGLKRAMREPYHVRVLVPCYKEPLDILQRTITAALNAHIPQGCRRTVYLCDDGKDPGKKAWVDSMGPDVQFVSGRKRPVGEMNGKSGNLNSCAAQLYPRGSAVPSSELLCIFDADQVAGEDFFLRTVPKFDAGSNVGMVLSPQCFHNLDPNADIFNHSNIHFWEYMQPGYDALGFISCTGTNFLMRANAFIDAGGSPTYTLTEDFALGMEMLKRGWKCRYVSNYLAVGESPEQIRNCNQQRSRWVKGHFQIMFSWRHCPMLQRKLSIFMRIMYMSGVWSYIVGAISTPLFMLIPMLTIWFGIFPIIISWWMALALTIYMAAMYCVMYNIRRIQHVQALWFANCCNGNLWWTYVKACYRALATFTGGNGIKFKTTVKGSSVLMSSAFRDLWMPTLTGGLLIATIIGGIVKLATQVTFSTPLAISTLWAAYQVVPPILVISYAILEHGSVSMTRICRAGMIISFVSGITAVGLLWNGEYASYNYSQVANDSTYFYRTQMVGSLPSTYDVPWRQSALLQETDSGPGDTDISGGWLTGALAGNLKMTMPTAFTVSMLAWGLLSFPVGYSKSAGATDSAQDQVVWGADYLMKTIVPTSGGGFSLIYQVGNYTVDQAYWGRPEDITSTRPYYAVPLSGTDAATTAAVDLGGAVAAALVAAYVAAPERPQAAEYLNAGLALYTAATASSAGKVNYTYADSDAKTCGNGTTLISPCDGDASSLYQATTYHDQLFWAAAWLYKATGNESFANDADTYASLYDFEEDANGYGSFALDWSNVLWTGYALMAQLTNISSYGIQTQAFLHSWICDAQGNNEQNQIRESPRGRVWLYRDPALATTSNSAFVAVALAEVVRHNGQSALGRTYSCWAQSQIRYMLGDAGQSFVVGYGHQPPGFPAIQAASCPLYGPCSASSSELSGDPNPEVATGALIYGPTAEDITYDSRLDTSNLAAVQYNAGFQGVAAGLAQDPDNWYQCKQKYGITVTDQSFCSRLKREGG